MTPIRDQQARFGPGQAAPWSRATRRWPLWLLLAAAVGWAVFVGGLAVARHQALQSNAFDLGYVSQVLWNTAHGHPFQFSTLIDAPFQVEGLDPSAVRHPGWLFAFHVEPALLAIVPFYAAWPDPAGLLWLQAFVITLGALPAGLLGRAVTGSRAAGLALGVMWLLAPGMEGAALSDFHMVALAAPVLMLALALLHLGRWRWAYACLAFVALCREDAALSVAWLSLVLAVLPRAIPAAKVPAAARWALFGATAAWAAACFLVIAPLFNGQGSVFWSRYDWLGATPLQAAGGVVRHPTLLLGWFHQPAVGDYFALQLLTGGVVALLAPAQLVAALPLLAVNGLSSFDWMRSGGGHYSALLVPFLLWAAAHGLRRAAQFRRRAGARAATMSALALAVGAAAAAQVWIGVQPWQPGVRGLQDPRSAPVLATLAAVPQDAPLSASSGLYPHLSNRRLAYWFPANAPGSWLAVDVAGTTHPLDPATTRTAVLNLLEIGGYRVAAASDGLLVLAPLPPASTAGHGQTRASFSAPAGQSLVASAASGPAALPPAFLNFVRVAALPAQAKPLGPVYFGPSLELVAYELRRWPAVGLQGDDGTLVTYWRVTSALTKDLRFSLATTSRADGSLTGIQQDAAAGALWYPTSRWAPGELIQLQMSVASLADIRALGVAVTDASGQPVSAAGPVDLWQDGTIAKVAAVH